MLIDTVFELNYASVTIWMVTFLLLWIVTRRDSRLPPGPTPLPIVGNLLNMNPKDMIGTCDRLRAKYGDIFCFWMGSQLTVVICGYQNLREALITQGDAFSDRPKSFVFEKMTKGRGFVGTSGEQWKEQRSFVHQTLKEFGFGKRSLETRVREEVEIFIEALEETRGESYDAGHLARVSISNIICSIVFGYTHDHRDPHVKKIMDSIEENFTILGYASILNIFPFLRFLPGDLFKLNVLLTNSENTGKLMRQTVQEHIDTFDENNIRDFIDAYIKEMRKREGQTGHFFSEEQLLGIIGDLFATGTESTAETVVWAILYLIHYPEAQDKMRSEIDHVVGMSRFPNMDDQSKLPYCEAAINEILRISDLSPFAGVRSTSCDVVFKGYRIPKGTGVLPNTHSVVTDPEIFENPDKFDPTRFLNERGQCETKEKLLTFSMGKRNCIGEKLARMELFLFVTAMVQRFTLVPEKDKPLPSLEGTFTVTRKAKPFMFCAEKRT